MEKKTILHLIGEGNTISGKPILLKKEDPENWIRVVLSAMQVRICIHAEFEPWEESIWESVSVVDNVIAAIKAAVVDPRFQEGLSIGHYLSNGDALLPEKLFTATDLINFGGLTGTGVLADLLEDLNLPPTIDYITLYLATGLILIDEAITALENKKPFLSAYLTNKASEALESMTLIKLSELTPERITEEIQKAMTARGLRGAKEKLKKDPKQAAKKAAKTKWDEWQKGKSIHKSGAAFARHVVSALPEIESEETVKRWERAWRKETKNKH